MLLELFWSFFNKSENVLKKFKFEKELNLSSLFLLITTFSSVDLTSQHSLTICFWICSITDYSIAGH